MPEFWEERTGNKRDGMIFSFGKHKGLSVEEVPNSYLRWIRDNFDPDNERDAVWIEAAESELEMRDDSGYHIYD